MRKKRTINFLWLTERIKRHPVVISVAGGAVACIALLLILVLGMQPTRALVVDPTITLYESVGGGGMTEVGAEMLDWDIVDHPAMGYDRAYTYSPYDHLGNNGVNRQFWPTYPVSNRDNLAYAYRDGTSGFWNGTPTPKHVVLDGDTVRFMGYAFGVTDNRVAPAIATGASNQNNPPMDSFFTNKPENAFDSMSFTIRPSNLVPHTFREAGFLFNGNFIESYTGTNYNNTYYTGYQLVIMNSPANSYIGSNTLNMYLFYCGSTTGAHGATTGMPMHRNSFLSGLGTNGAGQNTNLGPTFVTLPPNPAPGVGAGTSTGNTDPLHRYFTTTTKGNSGIINFAGPNRILLGTYKSLVANDDTTPIDVRLEREPSGAFRLYIDGELKLDEPAPYNMNSATYAGFGFYMGYYGGHACPVLTVCQFDDVKFRGKYESRKGVCRVQFREYGTNLEIAEDQTEEDWAGTRFRVDPLAEIDPLDGTPPYKFLFSDPPDLDPLQLRPYNQSGETVETVITLYYERQSKIATKHASVDGAANNGMPNAPVHVSTTAGDPDNIIDYRIDIDNDGSPVTMQTSGATGRTPVTYSYADPAVSLGASYNRGTGNNLVDTLTPTAPANAYPSKYRLTANGASGTIGGPAHYAHAVEMTLTGIPAGTYKVYADFNMDLNRGTANLLATTANAGLIRGMVSGGTSPILATPPPPDSSLVSTWGSQLATFTVGAINTQQNFTYPNQLIGTVVVGPTGEAHVAVGLFAPRGTGTFSAAAAIWIESNVSLNSVTLEPVYSHADPGVTMSGAYYRSPVANLVDTHTPSVNGSTWQSRYRLTASPASPAFPANTYYAHAAEMELTGIAQGNYKVYADFGMNLDRGLAALLATTANAGLIRSMVSDSQILTPPPLNPSLVNTWGSQLATFTVGGANAPQNFNYTKQFLGTVTVGPGGTAYVSVGLFAPKTTTAIAATGTNWIESNINMHSVTLVPTGEYFTFNSTTPNPPLSGHAGHTNNAVTATRTTPPPVNATAYQNRYVLTTNSIANDSFFNIVQAQLAVPAGTYKVVVNADAQMAQQTANRVTNISLRGAVSTTSFPALPSSAPPALPTPWWTSATVGWGTEIVARCPFNYAVTAPPALPYDDVFDSMLVTVGPGEDLYISLGMFGDVAWSNSATTNRSVTTDMLLRSIELLPVDRFEVKDTLPAGLRFVPGSAYYTDGSGNPVNIDLIANTVTTAGGVDTVTWEFATLPAGVTSFHFKVRAVSNATDLTQNMYINGARFIDARTAKLERTNRTYHTHRYVLTEMFHSLADPSYLLKSTIHTIYNPNTTYYPGWSNYANIVKEHGVGSGDYRTWRYYGYTLDNDPPPPPGNDDFDYVHGVWKGEPPEEIFYASAINGWNPISASHTIHFYFVEDVKVTVRYVDKSNPSNEIKPPVSMLLPANINWNLSVSHMRPFDYWVYQGHSIDGAPYADGVYPTGFTFDYTEMDKDHEIILYFLEEFDYLAPVKNAYVCGDYSAPINGEEGNPAPVPKGGKLTYQLDIYNSHYPYPPESKVELDVVFVLDWSASMGGAANTTAPAAGTGRMQNTASDWLQARAYGAKLITEMSSNLFGTHPGSRISAVYANTAGANSNNSALVNLQLDTSFVDEDGFTPTFEGSLLSVSAPPSTHLNSDNAQFLRAAIDKLAGDDTVNYGENYDYLDNHFVNVRSTFTNIPVIVMISDFQMDEPYWSGAMKEQADRFAQMYPYGILLTVRLDHDGASQISAYSGTAYDDLMEQHLSPAGHDNWEFEKIPYTKLYENAKGDLISLLESKLPIPGPLEVTDIVPEDLDLDESSISHGGVYDPDTRTIKWVLSNEPKGMIPLTFDAYVTKTDKVFENTAHVLWPTGETDDTNTTYHCYYPAKKNAYINESATAENGEEDGHVMVKLNDKLTYTIDLYNDNALLKNPPRYDVLFVLDWSDSMEKGWMVPDQSAREYAKGLMMDMSEFVFDNYPESRVALLGMNTGPNSGTYSLINNCTDNPDYSYIQLQTDFLDEAAYQAALPSIQTSFAAPVTFNYDDNAQFLAAGINKLKGLSTTYGSSLGGSYPKPLIPRTDRSRTSVIVHISDFNMTEKTTAATNKYINNKTNPQEGYWSATMQRQADAFASAFPDGILMTVRLDHDFQGNFHNATISPSTGWDTNYVYSGFYLNDAGGDGFAHTLYDGYMTDFVTPNFTKVPEGTPYLTALSNAMKDFKKFVPLPPSNIIVTDVVPEGLEIDVPSIEPSGTYDSATRTVTWDLSEESSGLIILSFDTTVKRPGFYENTAHISYCGGAQEDTNTTYHKAQQYLLHVRQVVLNDALNATQPQMGFLTITNNGGNLPATCASGPDGSAVEYTTYALLINDNPEYTFMLTVPQNYIYEGHVYSYVDGDHDSGDRILPTAVKNGEIVLNFTDADELWLTLYIEPHNSRGDYDDSYATNDFGKVGIPPPDDP